MAKSTHSQGQSSQRAEPVEVPDEAPPLGIADKGDPRAGVAIDSYLAGLKPNSVRAARQGLNRALRLLGERDDVSIESVAWWNLRRVHLLCLRRALQAADYSPSTTNVTLATFRGLARCAQAAGQMLDEDLRRILAVTSLPIVDIRGWVLSVDEVTALFKTCRDDTAAGKPQGPRDGAVLGMLCAGMQREEVATMEVGDVLDAPTGQIFVEGTGDDSGRTVWLPDGAAVALTTWMEVRGPEPGPLWTRIRKGGHLVFPVTGLSGQSVFKLCERRGEQAGLKRGLAPVDLRRTFISRLLRQGVSPSTVQELVGHKRATTTARYVPPAQVTGSDTAKLFDIDY